MEQLKEGMVYSFGYARKSTDLQVLDRQLTAIKNFRPEIEDANIFTDSYTGKTQDREGYNQLKVILSHYAKIKREEDTVELIVKEVDRLGRNKEKILEELRWFKEHGIVVRILEIPTTLVDVDSANRWAIEMITNIVIEVYASLAQQEIEKREQRQNEGIAEAKKRGVKFGRPEVEINESQFKQIADKVVSGDITATEAMKVLNLKRNTYYKYFNKLYNTEVA